MCDGDFPKQRRPITPVAGLSFRHRRETSRHGSTGKSSLTISTKPDGVTATSQRSNRKGRTIWIVDAHGYGKRFIMRADEMLTVFLELESAIHEFAVSLIL